jgi:hypothetical protein
MVVQSTMFLDDLERLQSEQTPSEYTVEVQPTLTLCKCHILGFTAHTAATTEKDTQPLKEIIVGATF